MTVKFSALQLLALGNLIARTLPALYATEGHLSLQAATLEDILSKIKKKIIEQKEIYKLKLNKPEACALHALIMASELPIHTDLGNKLLQVSNEIHQISFNLNNN